MESRDPNEIVSTEEIAEFTEVDPRTVQRWCKSGELKSKRIGRNYAIIWKDFEAFWANKHNTNK